MCSEGKRYVYCYVYVYMWCYVYVYARLYRKEKEKRYCSCFFFKFISFFFDEFDERLCTVAWLLCNLQLWERVL